VQYPAIREIGQGLRLEYAQYREMLRLTKLRTRLSAQAAQQMRRGEVLQDLLMQTNGHPMSVEQMVVPFWAFKRKILEAVPPPFFKFFLQDFYPWLCHADPELVARLAETKELSSDIKTALETHFVTYFKKLKAQEPAAIDEEPS
jgi:F-type H+-transporting ATPase subunit alpha